MLHFGSIRVGLLMRIQKRYVAQFSHTQNFDCAFSHCQLIGGRGCSSRHMEIVNNITSHLKFCTVTDGSSNQQHRKQMKKRIVVFGISAFVFGVAAYELIKKSRQGSPILSNEESWFSFFKTTKPVAVDLPKQVPYLIVGGGTAAFAAYRAIRAADSTAKVLLVSEESYLPYMRPPLSKELWYSDDRMLLKQLKFKQWNGKERSLLYEKEGFYCKPMELLENEFGGVAVAVGQKVVRLDVKEKQAYLASGRVIAYNKCLIATGGRPRNIPVIENAGSDVVSRCTLFRNIDDFFKLYKITEKAQSVAVIGGGFLGSELACCLGKRGKETGMKVIQTFPEKGNMGLVLPEYLSRWSTEKVRREGVQVIPETSVTGCSYNRSTQQIVLQLSNGQRMSVDHIIIAVGLEPNTELAATSGLETDPQRGGFLVNAELEARSNVWVAGDAACFYDTQLGRRHVEHHDHAVVSGRLAGENMTGAGLPYWHQSMFWSDLGPDVGYEAIGLVDSSFPTVGVFVKANSKDTAQAAVQEIDENRHSESEKDTTMSVLKDNSLEQPHVSISRDYRKGIIFYLQDRTVVGIVMWNVFNKMAVARQLIKEGKTYDDINEIAKLFDLYG